MTSLSFPGNVSFGGTVSSPLFVSNQQIIAPFAAGTLSTLSVGSFASTFSSLTQGYVSTLTAASLTSNYANVSQSSVGSLTVTGQVGILTTTPQYGLDVNAAARVTGSLTVSGTLTALAAISGPTSSNNQFLNIGPVASGTNSIFSFGGNGLAF